MPSGRVRVAPPPARTGTGTGGGTGTGSGSVSSGGYDRFAGTLGLTADAPTGAIFPHHTEFPAANKYDWVRVVSSTTINGKAVIESQQFVCNENNAAKGEATKWEVRQNVDQSFVKEKNLFTRIKRSTQKLNTGPNQLHIVKFESTYGQPNVPIAFDPYRTDITKFFKIFNEWDGLVYLNIDIAVTFAENPEGSRVCNLYLQERELIYPFGKKDARGTLLTGPPLVKGSSEGYGGDVILAGLVNAAPRGVTTLFARASIRPEERYADFQNVIYLYTNHNAPIDLDILQVRLTISVAEDLAIINE